MKSLLISHVAISFLDFEHNRVQTGNVQTVISAEFDDYLKKILKKVLKSNNIKSVTVGSHHELFGYFSQDFEEVAKETTKRFFAVGRHADAMPDASVITMRCTYGGDDTIIAVKIDHQLAPYNTAGENDVRITDRQLLPATPRSFEAVIINNTAKSVYIIEQKYPVDGKNEYILNDYWIKGECSRSDSQKEKAIKKIIKKVQKETGEESYIPKLKSILSQNAVTETPVNVRKTIEQVIGSATEADALAEEAGISNDDEMLNYSGSSTVSIITDNGLKITVEADDIIDGRNIQISDGKIVISGFEKYRIR